jgi:hypothetical protein
MDQPGAFVRARVRTGAESDASAAELAKRITIETAGGRVHADGPEPSDDASWSVTLQVYVPRGASVSARTMNGGISLDGLNGQVRFAAENGGVSLTDMSGDVRGHTTNGGLAVRLDGAQWTGETLDVSTVNGGVNLELPENYSAQLETGTVHGGVSIDYPIAVNAKSKRIAVTLGSGGPLVRVVTRTAASESVGVVGAGFGGRSRPHAARRRRSGRTRLAALAVLNEVVAGHPRPVAGAPGEAGSLRSRF